MCIWQDAEKYFKKFTFYIIFEKTFSVKMNFKFRIFSSDETPFFS